MENEKTIDKMSTMAVNRLMIVMGAPMIVSMVLQALYNIVDSAFVSNMAEHGEEALNALTLAFPVQMLMVAVSIGTGVGVNALLARNLGSGNREGAGKTAGTGIFLGAVIFVLCLLFGIFGVKAYIATQTSNELIFNMAVDYLRICCVASIGIVFFSIFEKLLQATGLSLYSTIGQIAGAVVNIVFDPIMIYGLLGFPEMGVRGAAYATVLGQIVSFVLVLIFHLKYNKAVPNGLKYFKPNGKTIKDIYSIGLPTIIAQALMSFMTYGINVILVRVSEAAVTAYGLYYKIQQFILFAAFGLRDAITPIISFAYGMRDKKRIEDGIKYGMIYTLIIMVIGLALLEAFAAPLSSVFGLSGTTEELCVSAVRVISVSFIFADANIAFQGIFQALEGGIESLVVSVCRQFLFVLPVACLFSLAAIGAPENTWLVWLTFPIAEFVSCIIACIFMLRINRKKINRIS